MPPVNKRPRAAANRGGPGPSGADVARHAPDAPVALVTGSAGFIGFHLSARLLADGYRVIGLDAITDYYDISLKHRRHAILSENPAFVPIIGRVETPGLLAGLLDTHRPALVVHLAAQAGVRHSIEAPRSYFASNLAGTFDLLEAARSHPPAHLMLASTSSVYGANTAMPFAETDAADTPMSFYAATKKATESMAHSYAHLFALPVTMLRFFTVYGPWGRPDMALFGFTRAILNRQPITLYNHGHMRRDFTYVGDLVAALRRLADRPPPAPGARRVAPAAFDSLSPVAPFRTVNIGAGAPVALADFVAAIEAAAGVQAIRRLAPMQPGDVPGTWADTRLLQSLTGPVAQTGLAEGVARFVAWYREEYA